VAPTSESNSTIDRLTSVHNSSSVDSRRPVLIVFELLVLFQVVIMDQKRKSVVGGAT
jgi:hypothetical protein